MGYDLYLQQDPDRATSRGFARTLQRNHHGMGMVCEMLTRAGVFDETIAKPAFPDCPPYVRPEAVAELVFPWEEKKHEPTADEKIYAEVHHAIQSTPSPQPNRVPWFKFASNDGWHVTSEECRSIAAALRAVWQAQGTDLFADLGMIDAADADACEEEAQFWIDFHEVAALNGGYRVC